VRRLSRSLSGTAPHSATTGSPSVLAVTRPVARLVVPGPEVTRTTPGVPVSRPTAAAMNAAFCSCRRAREINEEYAGLIEKYPSRFGAFAAVPVDTPERALAEIEYALDVLRLDGVLLTSNSEGKYFGHPFYEPIFAELARRHVPAFVHPEDCPHIDELGLNRPSSVIEYPVDTARTLTNAIYTGVFQRYPNLTFITAHCGGVLPTLGWRIAEHTEMGRLMMLRSVRPTLPTC
jgi:predicted TIM-barrel fold metal-dependent hydrolase